MRTIYSFILMLVVCLSVTAQGVASRQHDSADSIIHQPITETSVSLNEVVITGLTGKQQLKSSPAPIFMVSHDVLERTPYTNVIDAISRQPGVSQITTGSGISKPVIRGMGYNRVVVVNNGIRQEGQQWGDEHGIEIDGNAVHSVEILKGPASLMYGSDALAGVLLFNSAPFLTSGTLRIRTTGEVQSNNGLIGYSANVAGSKDGLVWNTLYSGQFAHAYKNSHDGYVGGSGFGSQAFTQMLGVERNLWTSHLTLSLYRLTPSLIEGETNPEHPKSYGRTLPFQEVNHYKAVLDNTFYAGRGKLKFLVGYQQNRRQEYEESADECGLDFMLHTVNYDLRYLLPPFCNWKLAMGVSGMYQQSLNKGTEFLIPAYNLFDYGAFLTATKERCRWSLSGGLRYDHRHLNGHPLVDDGEERFSMFSRGFDGVSASIGVAYALSDRWHLKANLAKGFRAPNVSELASNGVHEGTVRYELGNNGLKPEHSWQIDLGIDYVSPILSSQLSLFANQIVNYIFSEKLADEHGAPIIMDEVEAYRFTSGDARIMGGEMVVDIHPLSRLHFSNAFSYLHAVQLHKAGEARHLPFIPAPRWLSELRYEIVCDGRTFSNFFVKAQVDCNFRQNHYYGLNHTETATPAYALLNLYAGTDIKRRGRKVFSLYLSCENLTNKAYQSHLSRLKYLDVTASDGSTGIYDMGRNFTVKFVLPLTLHI